MKRITKTATYLLLLLFIYSSMILSAQAVDKNIKIDLKEGKAFTIYNRYSGISYQKETAKVLSVTTQKCRNKKGYKETTIKVIFNCDFKPTENQIHKMIFSKDYDNYNSIRTPINTFVMNSKTYKLYSSKYKEYDKSKYADYSAFYSNLYASYDSRTDKWTEKQDNVTVTLYPWKSYGKGRTFVHESGDKCWVKFTASTRKIKIVYPSDAKNICVGFGGSSKFQKTTKDKQFETGKSPFTQTSYYSKTKAFFHFLKIC